MYSQTTLPRERFGQLVQAPRGLKERLLCVCHAGGDRCASERGPALRKMSALFWANDLDREGPVSMSSFAQNFGIVSG